MDIIMQKSEDSEGIQKCKICGKAFHGDILTDVCQECDLNKGNKSLDTNLEKKIEDNLKK